MSFTTEVGKISIHLYSSDKDSNIIEVKLDRESQEKFDKLKNQSRLGRGKLPFRRKKCSTSCKRWKF